MVVLSVRARLQQRVPLREGRRGAARSDRHRTTCRPRRGGRPRGRHAAGPRRPRPGLGRRTCPRTSARGGRRFTTDEAVLTGEPMPAEKRAEPVDQVGLADRPALPARFMGTVVKAGTGSAVVVSTGPATDSARSHCSSASGSPRPPSSEASANSGSCSSASRRSWSPRSSSMNILIGRPPIDALLFSLAASGGAHAGTAAGDRDDQPLVGAKRMAQKSVPGPAARRDRGLRQHPASVHGQDRQLARGQFPSLAAVDPAGPHPDEVFRLGLPAGTSSWRTASPPAERARPRALAALRRPRADVAVVDAPKGSFDFERRRMSVLMDGPEGRLDHDEGRAGIRPTPCWTSPQQAKAFLDRAFGAGVGWSRSRPATSSGMDGSSRTTNATLARRVPHLPRPAQGGRERPRSRGSQGPRHRGGVVTGDNDTWSPARCAAHLGVAGRGRRATGSRSMR